MEYVSGESLSRLASRAPGEEASSSRSRIVFDDSLRRAPRPPRGARSEEREGAAARDRAPRRLAAERPRRDRRNRSRARLRRRQGDRQAPDDGRGSDQGEARVHGAGAARAERADAPVRRLRRGGRLVGDAHAQAALRGGQRRCPLHEGHGRAKIVAARARSSRAVPAEGDRRRRHAGARARSGGGDGRPRATSRVASERCGRRLGLAARRSASGFNRWPGQKLARRTTKVADMEQGSFQDGRWPSSRERGRKAAMQMRETSGSQVTQRSDVGVEGLLRPAAPSRRGGPRSGREAFFSGGADGARGGRAPRGVHARAEHAGKARRGGITATPAPTATPKRGGRRHRPRPRLPVPLRPGSPQRMRCPLDRAAHERDGERHPAGNPKRSRSTRAPSPGGRLRRASPVPPPSKAAVKARADCDPPFTHDAQGHKHYKLQCL